MTRPTGSGSLLARSAYWLGLCLLAWGVLLVTHETGHILAGWSCGGTLQAFELRPWRLPYSLFAPNPCPLRTVWGGPILGCLLPLLFAWLTGWREARLIACFCLLGNGLYLAVGWITGDPLLDTQQLLTHGAWPLSLLVFCTLTISTGYLGLRRELVEELRVEG